MTKKNGFYTERLRYTQIKKTKREKDYIDRSGAVRKKRKKGRN